MSRKCTIHKDVVRLDFEAVVRKRKGHGHGAAAASGPLEFSEALARHVPANASFATPQFLLRSVPSPRTSSFQGHHWYLWL